MSFNRKRYKHNHDDNDMYIEEYCHNYYQYDKRARKESKERINDHLVERRVGVKRCLDTAVEDAYSLNVRFRSDRPQFIDQDDIIQNAANETNHQINNWDGVQLKQCKEIINSYEAFAKKAKNHQDQTSWKISGDFFFAPYIKKAKNFLLHFTHFITEIDEETRKEIQRLLYLSFARALFNGEIKFKRTKLKPLMRHRTLVKSKGIHRALEQLDAALTVSTFIESAREKRRQREGKTNIIAADLFTDFKCFVNKQYLRQKQKVHSILNMIEEVEDDLIEMDESTNSANSDIDDEDYVVTEEEEEEDDDDDINISEYSANSDTASSAAVIAPISHYKPAQFTQKKAPRIFQSIVMKNVIDKHQIVNNQRREMRRQRVDNLCASAVRSKSLHSSPYLSEYKINTARIDNECSDCVQNTNNHDDNRSFASLSTTPSMTPTNPSMSYPLSSAMKAPPPPQQQQRYRPFRYYPAPPQFARVPTASSRMIVQMIRRENEFLRGELVRMRFVLQQKSRFHKQQMMMNYYRHRPQAPPAAAVSQPKLSQAPPVSYTNYNNNERIPPAIDAKLAITVRSIVRKTQLRGEKSMLSDENLTHSTFASMNPEATSVDNNHNMQNTADIDTAINVNDSMQFIPDPNALSPEPFNFSSNLNLDSVFYQQNH